MMKKKNLIAIFFTCIASAVFSQYQAANWPIVYRNLVVKITADTLDEYTLPDCPYLGCGGPTGDQANTSVSDSNGNLLFFSFGNDVRNKYGDWVNGGCCLCQDTVDYRCLTYPHFQGALILPKPGSSSQYYIFIKDMDTAFNQQPMRVTATLIDIRANNDSGAVIHGPAPIIKDTILSDARMTACQHANGRDWWLINHQYLTNKIYTNLITPDSIYGPFEQDIGLAGLEPDNAGWSLFSSTATNLFATTTAGMGGITLLDFDRCTGLFGNFKNLPCNFYEGYYYFLAFSPNGRFLYAGNTNYLSQYDLQDTDIAASRIQLVHDTAGYPLLGQMVLMPNGKIYQVGWTVVDSMLSVIDSPNVKGLACGFHLRSVVIPNSIEITNVPNFPNYNLGPVVGSGCDTITASPNLSKGEGQIRIIPNPADNYLSIEMVRPGNYKLELFNPVGMLVITKQTSQVEIFNTERLSAGVYFVRVVDRNSGNEIASRKVVVMH